jgi:hypothetical protein
MDAGVGQQDLGHIASGRVAGEDAGHILAHPRQQR